MWSIAGAAGGQFATARANTGAARIRNGDANTRAATRDCHGDNGKKTNIRQNHTPGFAQYIVTGRSSGSPSSFPVPAFPCVAQWRSIKVVRLTAAGAAPDWRAMKIARVTGFPFHPPADKREDTIHVSTGILHAIKRRCTGPFGDARHPRGPG